MNQAKSLSQSSSEEYPSQSKGQLRALAEVASILLGLLLLFSAGAKIAAPKSFLEVIGQFQILPRDFIVPVAAGVTGLELSLALLFLTGAFRRVAAWLNLMLMMLFVGLMIEAIRRGFEQCGCFGEVLHLAPRQEIWIDVLLLLLTLVVIWRGQNRSWGSAAFRHTLAWGGLCLGAFVFLLGGPVPASTGQYEIDPAALKALAGAEPPIEIPQNGMIFLFSADCDHCWAFAGGVQMTANKLAGFEVHGVTFSSPSEVERFEESFQPSYPIHRISKQAFNRLIDVYPGAIWFKDGEVAEAWSGFVPSHRELANLGGYDLRQSAANAAPQSGESSPSGAGLFGGTISGRHH